MAHQPLAYSFGRSPLAIIARTLKGKGVSFVEKDYGYHGKPLSQDELKRALEEPTRQIAENSGADPGVVVDRMRSGTGNFGFDAAKNEWGDLWSAGIIDATKVVRVGLENAVSVAGVLLLTQATMTEIPEPRDHKEPGME